MPTIKMTARTVSSIKPTPGKRVEYFDAALPGLALRVSGAGAKTWTLFYRNKRGRLRRMTLASLTALPLAKARTKARDVLHAASNGEDPATDKQLGRKAQTIEDLAELYIAKWAKPHKRSWKADDNLLRNKVLPKWRHHAIADIRRRDVRSLIDGVAEAGAPIVANRVASLLSKMFIFAMNEDLIEISPAVRIPRPGNETQRDRVLTEDELRTFWKECGSLDAAAMGAYYKLRLLTAQRGGEVASMRWKDVDLDTCWWTIPAASSKNKLPHRVPLTATVVTLLKALLPKDAEPADYVLTGARGKRQQSEAAATFTVPDFHGHDLRRTAASLMVGSGIPRLTISKILNHVEKGVTAVYDRHSYDPEKSAALAWWDARLSEIIAAKVE